LIEHVNYALKMGWHFRKALRQYKISDELHAPTLFDLDLAALKASGVKVLALDFDGVLASHGEENPALESVTWLHHCLIFWPASSIYIVSNRPTLKRAEFFSREFPGIQFVRGARKKPYPDALLSLFEKAQVLPNSVCVVDDRLLTGILGALIVGAQARWITRPMVSLKKRPLTESFFWTLRFLERHYVEL